MIQGRDYNMVILSWAFILQKMHGRVAAPPVNPFLFHSSLELRLMRLESRRLTSLHVVFVPNGSNHA